MELRLISDSKYLSGGWLKGKSPLLDSWTLYDNPSTVVMILIGYISFVLYLGPKWMEKRKPYNLKAVIIVYNAVQVYFNFYILLQSSMQPIFWKYFFSFGCAQVTKQEEAHYHTLICWAFWNMTVNKLLDLLDTVFFILCKKQNHITFLHVQHHALSISMVWIAGKWFTGQEFTSIYFCNIIVHTIMYSYYFIAALGPAYKKYLWWKKYLTMLQMVQFVVSISYLVASIWLGCGYDQLIVWALISTISLNLVLFLNFYFKAYGTKKCINDKIAVCGSLQFNNNYVEDIKQANKNVEVKKEM